MVSPGLLALAGAAILLALLVAVWRADRRARALLEGEERAWAHGREHGLRDAARAVADYPKPYITLGEEHGWVLARDELAALLAGMVEDAGRDTPPGAA